MYILILKIGPESGHMHGFDSDPNDQIVVLYRSKVAVCMGTCIQYYPIMLHTYPGCTCIILLCNENNNNQIPIIKANVSLAHLITVIL